MSSNKWFKKQGPASSSSGEEEASGSESSNSDNEKKEQQKKPAAPAATTKKGKAGGAIPSKFLKEPEKPAANKKEVPAANTKKQVSAATKGAASTPAAKKTAAAAAEPKKKSRFLKSDSTSESEEDDDDDDDEDEDDEASEKKKPAAPAVKRPTFAVQLSSDEEEEEEEEEKPKSATKTKISAPALPSKWVLEKKPESAAPAASKKKAAPAKAQVESSSEEEEEEEDKEEEEKDQETSDKEQEEEEADEESETSESDSDEDKDEKQKPAGQTGARYRGWLISADEPQKPKEDKEDKRKKKEEKKEEKRKKQESGEERAAAASAKISAAQSAQAALQPSDKAFVWTDSAVEKSLQEIAAMRGRKGTDPIEQIAELEKLSRVAQSPAKKCQVLVQMLSTQFDTTSTMAVFMNVEIWRAACKNLVRILALLHENSSIELIESEEAIPDVEIHDETKNESQVLMAGNLQSFIDRLHSEYTKSLQNTDPHTLEYLNRFRDDTLFLDVAEKAFIYYQLQTQKQQANSASLLRASRIALHLIDHLYYRRQSDHEKLLQKQRENEKQLRVQLGIHYVRPQPQPRSAEDKPVPMTVENAYGFIDMSNKGTLMLTEDLRSLLWKLSSMVFKSCENSEKVRAMLSMIYHLAQSDRFYEARDMLLMSRIQDSIHQQDAHIQVLFNRVMAQLGLAAFRAGLLKECLNCLSDLCSKQRVEERELLAQGISPKSADRKPEQEKLERARLIPYHMHINIDMMEAAHLIAAMLFEIPNMAKNPHNSRKNVISKAFRRLLDFYDRQVFVGPPENTKDHINAASRSLMRGDWMECDLMIRKMSIWSNVPNKDAVQNMLTQNIKETALRTYLFTFSRHFETISLRHLTEMFELPSRQVHSIVSRMIVNDEFFATWHQPTNTIVMQRVEPSKLQSLALYYVDRVTAVVDYNDKLFEQRTGGQIVTRTAGQYAAMSKGQYQPRQQQQQQQQQMQGRHHQGKPQQRKMRT